MIDWTRGYTSTFRAYEVDRRTWTETSEIGRVDTASVDNDSEGALQSGALSITASPDEQFGERYVRIRLDADQSNSTEHVDIVTLLCTAASGAYDHNVDTLDVEGRSVLYPASTRMVHDIGTDPYAPMGADGAAFAAQLLRKCIAAPVSVECSFLLGRSVVFDPSDSYLDAAWEVLDVGGCIMQVDGRGVVHILEAPEKPDPDYGVVSAAQLMPGVGHELDYSEIPNRYFAVYGATTASAENDDPASPTSTVTRGYYVDERDESPKLKDGESLAMYARRKLAERSVAYDTRNYKREYIPGVLPGSMVRVQAAGMDGMYRVRRQSLAIGRGITVDEESVEEVRTWQG